MYNVKRMGMTHSPKIELPITLLASVLAETEGVKGDK